MLKKLSANIRLKLIYGYLLLSSASALFMFVLECANIPAQGWHQYITLPFYSPSDVLNQNPIIRDINREIISIFPGYDSEGGKYYYRERIPYFELLALVGLAIALLRQKPTHRLVLLFFCMQLILTALYLLLLLKSMFSDHEPSDYWYMSGYLLLNLLHFAFAFFSMRTLLEYYKPMGNAEMGNEDHNDFIKQTNWQRFFNHFTDNLLMMILVITVFMGYHVWKEPFSFAKALGIEYENIDLYIYVKLFLLVYYVIFEFLFGVTIGKVLTVGIVLSTDCNTLTFQQTVVRALIRITPAYAFLFLFYPLHDEVSETSVYKGSLMKKI